MATHVVIAVGRNKDALDKVIHWACTEIGHFDLRHLTPAEASAYVDPSTIHVYPQSHMDQDVRSQFTGIWEIVLGKFRHARQLLPGLPELQPKDACLIVQAVPDCTAADGRVKNVHQDPVHPPLFWRLSYHLVVTH